MFSCRMCGAKDPTAFYSYQKGECKGCTRLRVLANRNKNIGYYREFDRIRSRTAVRKKQYSDKQKSKRAKEGPLYVRAHNAVKRAVNSGKLVRATTCERCDAKDNIQGHHDDYAKALSVMWLCPVCHAQRHIELGRLNKMTTL